MGFWSRLFGGNGSGADEAADPGAAGAASGPGPSDRGPGKASDATGGSFAGQEPPTGGSPPPGAADAPQGRQPEWLARLERLGQPGGVDDDEAVAALRQTQGTSEQSLALQALLRALGSSGEQGHEGLRAACAAILVDRGQPERALELVRECRTVEAMMLAAELHASAGQLARAVSTVERVLARRIDTPGARERHEQWSAQLGRAPTRDLPKRDDGATVIAPSGPKTPFRLLREVARGGAGTVYEAEDDVLGRRLAYKLYYRAAEDRAQIEREARTAIALEGPGVVRVYDADPSAGWLAMEWLGRGTLRDAQGESRLDALLPLERWMVPLLAALERVHQAGLVHADLKPANVFFRTPDEPVLGDFGISRRRGEPSAGGTPGYLSPERLAGGPAEARDDVYALGRILEDALAALEQAATSGKLDGALDAAALARWSAVARACLTDATTRPADATAVLAMIAGTR